MSLVIFQVIQLLYWFKETENRLCSSGFVFRESLSACRPTFGICTAQCATALFVQNMSTGRIRVDAQGEEKDTKQ